MIHEYSTILLERLTQERKKGWHFFEAPRWFTDGIKEYLGLTQTSERNRRDIVGKYLALRKENPERIDFGLNTTDPYIDGSLLHLFMHERMARRRSTRFS